MLRASLIDTERGQFELFKKGKGPPLTITHLYSEFNEKGRIMSQDLSEHYTVHVINLSGAGRSVDQTDEYTYSMDDAIHDLEAIRESLRFDEWTFSVYSTGGFLALKYAVMCPGSLTKIIAGGLCASYEYMEHASTLYCKDNPSNQRMKEMFTELRKPEIPLEEHIVLSKEWIMMSLYRKDAYYELLNRK
ncbi:alpha/beta fold hydrolase [Salinicoccus sp. RF5]|uniref:alpha/beta fold hydrolase n=1 Tax=Salinicoccus sp. RF5 TaxID=2748874 RepID=UPI001E5F1913|nr:alpha/beta fold hydrolase [Salinicoccus sp. RF5]MCC4721855.1 alpha/beta hydrolase [Salinicoccus sp. RF5]